MAQLRPRAPTQVRFRGRLSHAQLQQEMPEYDIALAPYGRIVRGAHTPPGESLASWMSPLKIFEYMAAGLPIITRSEEHTSELQSLMRISYAVFCLKKKKIIKSTT